MAKKRPEGIASFVADLRTLEGEPVPGPEVMGSFSHFLKISLLMEDLRLA